MPVWDSLRLLEGLNGAQMGGLLQEDTRIRNKQKKKMKGQPFSQVSPENCY